MCFGLLTKKLEQEIIALSLNGEMEWMIGKATTMEGTHLADVRVETNKNYLLQVANTVLEHHNL